jgi:predicted amidophosphoribosyltransferase
MRFDDNTVICEDCGREISESHDWGDEDNPVCSGCMARRGQKHAKTLCEVCKKPLGMESFLYHTDDPESRLIHEQCKSEVEDPDAWSEPDD